MPKPPLIAAAIGAVVYPALLVALSAIVGPWQPLGMYALFVPAGAIAGAWLMLMWP